ncbi:MAG TPA: hypothetical protein VLT47_08325 [Anaeromyxobacteraceae bacterium]|nr:hypothetical protein [Anaeromyxobacteraceae bacterium]
MTWRFGLSLAVAIVGVGAAAAPAAGGVTLRFAWPERLEGKRVEKRQGRAAAEPARRSALKVERRGAETVLTVRPADADEQKAAEEREEDPELPVVVAADGRFLRLDGVDAWVEEQAAGDVPEAAPRAERDAARREARERAVRLEAEAREQWSYQVEAWLGRTLELGRTQEITGRVPIAAVPGLEVEQRVTLSARRWVSCAPGGIDRRCLELTLTAAAGPEAFRKGLAAAGGKEAKGFEDGAMAVEMVLVTDPETLLPWRYTFTKKLRLVFAGRGLSVDQVERREREYQWWKA